MSDRKRLIKRFIEREIAREENQSSLKETDLLIESGIIDSLGIQLLLTYLEDTFSLYVPDDELTPENFETLQAISDMVDRLIGKKPLVRVYEKKDERGHMPAPH